MLKANKIERQARPLFGADRGVLPNVRFLT